MLSDMDVTFQKTVIIIIIIMEIIYNHWENFKKLQRKKDHL